MTDRQRRILLLAADGYSNQQIADQLAWSLRTIKNDLAAVCRELGARNRIHAVAVAIRRGYI